MENGKFSFQNMFHSAEIELQKTDFWQVYNYFKILFNAVFFYIEVTKYSCKFVDQNFFKKTRD
jgi:hypothetical protein